MVITVRYPTFGDHDGENVEIGLSLRHLHRRSSKQQLWCPVVQPLPGRKDERRNEADQARCWHAITTTDSGRNLCIVVDPRYLRLGVRDREIETGKSSESDALHPIV